MLIAGIFLIYSPLGILGIVGLYGLYILYLGFAPVLKTPEDKLTGYFVVSLVTILVAYFIIAAILGAITAVFAITGAAALIAH
jgi:hypothetical protein